MLLSVNTFVSLDGVMQGPGAPEEDPSNGFERGGWVVPFVDQLGGVVDDDWFAHADAILLGRTTYQLMQPYWSAITDSDDPVATALNGLPKYVVSTTLTPETATWDRTEVIAEDVTDRVAELKQAPGRELQVHGSWQLAQTLHRPGWSTSTGCWSFPSSSEPASGCSTTGRSPSRSRWSARSRAVASTALELRPREYTVGTFLG